MDIKIPHITWVKHGEKSNEELDNLPLQRFNIKNFKSPDDYKDMQNFYVFKVMDLDENSETGYYGMCINKKYAQELLKIYNGKRGNTQTNI